MTIDRDIVCMKCKYDLRGLPLTGKCPECGAAIVESVRLARIRWTKAFTLISPFALALLHFLFLILMWEARKTAADAGPFVFLSCANLPLVLITRAFGADIVLWSSAQKFWFFFIGGTVMYALIGLGVGMFIDRMRLSKTRRRGR